MTIRIKPQDFLFAENLTPIQVQTEVSKELIGDGDLLLSHIRHYKLAAGTVILVQVMNRDKDRLFHEAEFRVTVAVQSQQIIEDDYGSKARPQTQYAVERWTAWRSTSFAPAEETPVEAESAKGTAQWNVGKKAYDIIVAGKFVVEITRNDGETKEDFKARAVAIAAGQEPLPKAA